MLINDSGGGVSSDKKPGAGNRKGRKTSGPKPGKPGAGNRGGKGTSGWKRTEDSTGRRLRDARVTPDPKKKKTSAPPKNNSKSGPKKDDAKKSKRPKKDKSIRAIKRNKSRKNPPKPKKNTIKTEPTKTYQVTNLTGWQNQEQELLNAYISMAGTELFQYSNAQTIDGAYNDVVIINVLSSRRRQYTPNRLIELYETYIKSMWVEAGNLCIDIDNSSNLWDQCVLSFSVGTSSVTMAKTVN